MVRADNKRYLFPVLCTVFMLLVVFQLKFSYPVLNLLTALVGLVITISYININTKE